MLTGMRLVEWCLEQIAPHTCFGCGQEGILFCYACSQQAFVSNPSRCYRCHIATKQSSVCPNCRRKTSLSHVWVSTRYHAEAKELIHRFKFKRAKQAAAIIAETLDTCLPLLPDNILVLHLPTARHRIRVRGYDQARLIAREVCTRRKWNYSPLLLRRGTARQLGATRKQRFEQLEDAFVLRNPRRIHNMHILLIDDVLTTGASIESAARVLKEAGAKTIDAAVFAQP